MEFGKHNWKTFEQGIQKEWLLTNGIGGYASSTIIGANTRRYHGLLVAALKPPTMRHLVLSKMEESLLIEGVEHRLYSNQTPNNLDEGYRYLEKVVIDHLPLFMYRIQDVFLEKKVCMVYGKNTVTVVYKIINGPRNISFQLKPLVNFRDHHENSRKENMNFSQRPCTGGVIINTCVDKSGTDIKIICSEGNYSIEENKYFTDMEYAVEMERGLHALDDHYIPGSFKISINAWEEKVITFLATTEKELNCTDGEIIIEDEEKRISTLVNTAGYEDEFARRLVEACDKFIVQRQSTDKKTVIAGYPWFTDWGRDTMIALSGLTLTTHRFEDARDILITFSKHMKNGLIPNVFPDDGQDPLYNTVDASLWYFEAINKYIHYTGDYKLIKDELYVALIEIIEAYINGTDFSIGMDEDYLLTAGEQGSQLTWMDVKVGNWVVTPRHGKAVEVNSLWYNALKVMFDVSEKLGYNGNRYNNLACNVKKSFIEKFWNEDKQCLYDIIIQEDEKDSKVRPNQIIALSLSYPIIEGNMAKKVVNKVWKELYTAYGLRSLSPKEQEYIGTYSGNILDRDGAYHQGTVWAWLLGHFVTAYLKAYGSTPQRRKFAMRFLDPIKNHLEDSCIGSVSEIFDGNEPLLPRGCFAQAWSVAEILRAYVEDIGIK
jgi:predicted glycogen debranching enzyme